MALQTSSLGWTQTWAKRQQDRSHGCTFKQNVRLPVTAVCHSLWKCQCPFCVLFKDFDLKSQHVTTCKKHLQNPIHTNQAYQYGTFSIKKKSNSNSSVLSCDYTAALCFLDAFCTCDRNFRKSFFLLPQISPPLRGGAMVTPLRRWSTKYRFVFYFMETGGGGGLFFYP